MAGRLKYPSLYNPFVEAAKNYGITCDYGV